MASIPTIDAIWQRVSDFLLQLNYECVNKNDEYSH